MKHSITKLITAVLVVAIIGSAVAIGWLHSELETPYLSVKTGEVFVDVPRGAKAYEIADLLTKAGVLKHRLPFRIYLRYSNSGRRIQAGEYRFSQPATPKRIVQRLVQGDVFFYSVTVPEGLSAHETVELLAKNGLGNPVDLDRALSKTDLIADLDPKAKNLEGYLFPETYRFKRKTDPETIIKTMVGQFRARIGKILQLYPVQPGWSISNVVILASMIEKEIKQPEEGPLVASVLINRLDKRMPLACDATIIYAMKSAGIYEGRLGKADLEIDSPYNTYRHPNLPPGPICNPGANAIQAALNPAKTDYFYYVSRNDGTHQFSKDFRSHLNAVNTFQRPLAHRR